MKVFVTGATGFIGTAVVKELLSSGHKVLGLARSEESAHKLKLMGAEVHKGDLTHPESLQSGALQSDAVIHLGFIHDFTRFEEVCAIDKKAIEAIGEALLGTERPFLVTSGTAIIAKESIATENDDVKNTRHPRIATEKAVDEISAKGVKACVIRLPPSVHGEGDDYGFIPILIRIAKEKGISAMINEGHNVWPAVNRLDVAQLFRLILEQSFNRGYKVSCGG
ncbi:NAD-dependent epimerase/dehydratase family protein [Chryseobacterium nematophagum]|uniref:NAD-dependent epimerase/dehydratase family protein n=1 Tax=Chryseobacterium nematophagum TaxID=2305228 RepID=UPI001E2AD3E2|nr:NAD-dependent epimerase/dehydratase family protein [Chryseobacterium nematophagum]